MVVEVLDTKGLRCPQPVLRIAAKAPDMQPEDILEVIGDCPTFEKDIRVWCQRLKKTFLFVKEDGNGIVRIQIKF